MGSERRRTEKERMRRKRDEDNGKREGDMGELRVQNRGERGEREREEKG